jgi:hypothetical protein
MQVTDRDKALLRWLNGFGAAITTQVAQYMGVDPSIAARRLRVLIEAGLLEKRVIQGVSYRVLICTAAGCRESNDDLPPLQGIRRGVIYHDLKVIDVARRLIKKFGGNFEPARRILHRREAIKKADHCPDGLFYLPIGKTVAVELELSAKSPRRLRQIFAYYATALDIDRVLYLTTDPAVARLLKRIAQEMQCGALIQIETI